MIFKKLHLGSTSFTSETLEEIHYALTRMDNKNKEDLKQSSENNNNNNNINSSKTKVKKNQDEKVKNTILALALCHNVTPVIEDGEKSYKASSPDEVALVKFTESVGLTLDDRSLHEIVLKNSNGDLQSFQVLQNFPFTSDRKRMGIIIKNHSTDQIVFYMKGADAVMAKIVTYNDWLDEECNNMAREGFLFPFFFFYIFFYFYFYFFFFLFFLFLFF